MLKYLLGVGYILDLFLQNCVTIKKVSPIFNHELDLAVVIYFIFFNRTLFYQKTLIHWRRDFYRNVLGQEEFIVGKTQFI